MNMEQKQFVIRHSRPDDLPVMLKIYEHARLFMAEHGNPRQWGATNWPPEKLLKEDIKTGHSYIVCVPDGRAAGTFAYFYGQDIEPTYLHIEKGEWPAERLLHGKGSTYGVVHRLAGDGSEKGIGEAALNWAFEQSHHLRVDTHPDNKIMQNLLSKLGFVQCGSIYVREDHDPRLAYEKLPGLTNENS